MAFNPIYIDSATAGAQLSIGTTNSNTVNIGNTNCSTNINGIAYIGRNTSGTNATYLEFGSGTTFNIIDFHSSGLYDRDYDLRLTVTGGGDFDAGGTMTITGNSIVLPPITTSGVNIFKHIYFGTFKINANAAGYSSLVTLPSLSNGYYIVDIGVNFNDPNVLNTFRVTIGGGLISSVSQEIGNAYNSFGVRLGTWSGLGFNINNVNYPPHYSNFSAYYYPICVFPA